MDSAFCNRQSRRRFSALTYEKSKVYLIGESENNEYGYIRFLRWIAARGAHMDMITLTNVLLRHDELCMKLLSASGGSITTLQSYNCDLAISSCFPDIVKLCPNVVDAHIDSTYGVGQEVEVHSCLEAVTRGFQQLTTLTITVFTCTAIGLARALAHCKCLKSLTIVGPRVNTGISVHSLTYLDCRTACVEDADVLVALGQRCGELETLYVKSVDRCDKNDHITEWECARCCWVVRSFARQTWPTQRESATSCVWK
jgi:hypothetical protein